MSCRIEAKGENDDKGAAAIVVDRPPTTIVSCEQKQAKVDSNSG